MTQRTKIYIKNARGQRSHLLVLRGRLSMSQTENLHKSLADFNASLRGPNPPAIVAITLPEDFDYQVIKL